MSYFNSDEHWQGPEVAHRITFGYGHLTWEWKQGIQSYLHPFLFVPLYKFLAQLRLDTPWFLVVFLSCGSSSTNSGHESVVFRCSTFAKGILKLNMFKVTFCTEIPTLSSSLSSLPLSPVSFCELISSPKKYARILEEI
ncbi:hypothetical protein P8452_06750 [Trifolium repens]|nr:hypothetical protein P8452_06750 [Trifolium repens]